MEPFHFCRRLHAFKSFRKDRPHKIRSPTARLFAFQTPACGALSQAKPPEQRITSIGAPSSGEVVPRGRGMIGSMVDTEIALAAPRPNVKLSLFLLTERSIINFLIWVGGLIAGPYLVIATLSGNYTPLMAVAGIFFTVFVFGVMRDKICFLPLVGLFVNGHFNFLPLRLAFPDLCGMALVAYYLVAYVALQRKKVKTGPFYFFLPILLIAAIVLYHGHNAGLRSMGGGQEGAPVFFSKIPLYCLWAAVFSGIPYTLSTYVPSLSPYLALVTDNINNTAAAVTETGDEGVVRNAGSAQMAMSLMAYLVSVYPIGTWWRPNRWGVSALGLMCCALVVMGGFRSTFSNFVVMIFAATWCHYSWRSLVILPPLALGVFLVTAAQDSHLVHVPLAAQRSLSFLPGDWDPVVAETALSSNTFRDKIQKVYLAEDFAKSPWIGNGFSYDSDEFQRMNYLAKTQETIDGYYSTKIFVTGKIFHIGWISVYDSVGLIGSAAFVFLGLRLIWVVSPATYRTQGERQSSLFPLKVWMFANNCAGFIGFFTVFGDFRTAFPGFCYYAIIVTHLNRLDRQGYTEDLSLREFHFDPNKAEITVPA
jgi:hypothetical protein